MNLHLVLTYHWFDEIEAGKKTVEYRDKTMYWYNRIWLKRKEIKTVTFSRGYTSRTLTFDVTAIDEGTCPYPKWDKEYVRVHFKRQEKT